MTIKHIDYQLTPAVLNQRNWSECEIQTSKNNFTAGLCSTDPNFPFNLWWKLVTQSVITFNPLWPSWINTKISDHAQVFGNFNDHHTPMDPPGIKVIIH